MRLTDEELRFVAKRARLARTWPYVGAMLLVVLVGLGGWLLWSKPLLANPFEVLSRLSSGTVPASTMELMAGLLPVVVQLCLMLAGTTVLLVFAAFSNEKKYLRMIRARTEDAPSVESGKSPKGGPRGMD